MPEGITIDQLARYTGEPENRLLECAAEVAARLSLEGAERAFRSEACLRKFVASPEAYGQAT